MNKALCHTLAAASASFALFAQAQDVPKSAEPRSFAEALVEIKADIAQLAPQLAARTTAKCQADVDSKSGPLTNAQMVDVLKMDKFIEAHPGKAYDIRQMWKYLIDTDRFMCFDERAAKTPYSSVLYFAQPVTSLNPRPLDATRPLYALQAAALDAAEHLYGADVFIQTTHANRSTLVKPSFVRLDLNNLDGSQKSVDAKLVPEFSRSPAQRPIQLTH